MEIDSRGLFIDCTEKMEKKINFFTADSAMITDLKSAIFFFTVLYNVAAT